MKARAAISVSLALICFSVTLAIYQQLLVFLTSDAHSDLLPLIRFTIAAGLFALLFQATLWMANTASERWLSDESKLAGRWYQVFHINNYAKSDEPIDAIRHGEVTVVQRGGMLEISALNCPVASSQASSTWHSQRVSLEGTQVWLLYSSTGAGRGSTHGNMVFQQHTDGQPAARPSRLVGTFADSSPATHYGSIEIFRNKELYEKRLQELTERAGAE